MPKPCPVTGPTKKRPFTHQGQPRVPAGQGDEDDEVDKRGAGDVEEDAPGQDEERLVVRAGLAAVVGQADGLQGRRGVRVSFHFVRRSAGFF